MSGGMMARSGRMGTHVLDLIRQVPFLVASAIVFAICGGILASFDIPLNNPIDTLTNSGVFLLSLLFMTFVDIVVAFYRTRPASPLAFAYQRYWSVDLLLKFLVRAPIFLMLIVFMPLFGQMKSLIPLIRPFTWDSTFIAADRAIFGTDAWLWLQPLVGYPIITSGLGILYHAWIMLLYPGTLFMLLHSSCDQIRQRYFLSFVLIWSVIGIVMATMFASVGPCFLEPIKADARFAPLMTYLKVADEHYPVMVLFVQDLLLESYRNREFGLGTGITAMPSMHVAMAFLYYLAIREVSRWAGRAFLVFTILIWIASVHLAYHYAVDGLVSIIVTAVLWFFGKHVVAWWERVFPTLGPRRKATGIQPA